MSGLMIKTKAGNLDMRFKVLDQPPECTTVDAVAILTEWEIFKDFNYGETAVFDGRNILKTSNLRYWKI